MDDGYMAVRREEEDTALTFSQTAATAVDDGFPTTTTTTTTTTTFPPASVFESTQQIEEQPLINSGNSSSSSSSSSSASTASYESLQVEQEEDINKMSQPALVGDADIEKDTQTTMEAGGVLIMDAGIRMRDLLRRHWAILVLMWLAHAAVGATNALPGSCLLVLARRVGASLSAMGLWFTMKSAGACLLAVAAGCVFPRLLTARRRSSGLAFLAGANLACAAGIAAVPLVRSLWAALALSGVIGAGQGALETADGILAILLFGSRHSRPVLQSLHLSVALGALAAPALLHPFRDDEQTEPSSLDSSVTEPDAPTNATIPPIMTAHQRSLKPVHSMCQLPLSLAPSLSNNDNNNVTLPPPLLPLPESPVLHPPLLAPFAIVHAVQLLAALGFLTLMLPPLFRSRRKPALSSVKTSPYDVDSAWSTPAAPNVPTTTTTTTPLELLAASKPALPTWRRHALVGLTVAFYYCFVGVENVFWSFIGAYGVCSPHLQLSALNAAFFAGFLAGRCLGVLAARWLRPTALLLLDLAGCQASLTVLCLTAGTPAPPWLTVAATAGFGLCVASLYAGGISWLEERLNLAGPVACSWTLGSQLGVSTLPALAGHLLVSPALGGPAGVAYLAMGGFTAACLCFGAMLAVANLRF